MWLWSWTVLDLCPLASHLRSSCPYLCGSLSGTILILFSYQEDKRRTSWGHLKSNDRSRYKRIYIYNIINIYIYIYISREISDFCSELVILDDLICDCTVTIRRSNLYKVTPFFINPAEKKSRVDVAHPPFA